MHSLAVKPAETSLRARSSRVGDPASRVRPNSGTQRTRASVVARAAVAVTDVQAAVDLVKQASKQPGSVPPLTVLQAIIQLEQAKLEPTGWYDYIQAPGAVWRLIFTADKNDITKAKKQENTKGGYYFPISAAQRFTRESRSFENGIFLGNVAHLVFEGPFSTPSERQLYVDVAEMRLGLGPWEWAFPLKKPQNLEELDKKAQSALPFFLYAYVDADVMVGRGKDGGVAVWSRADPDWLATVGALRAYHR